MRKLFVNNNGDTIVEVLIAIAILALVLTGAYTSSEQSLNDITEAGQRTKALDIAQAQIETLRANAATASFGPYVGANSCYDTATDTFTSFSTSNCTSQSIYVSEISPITTSPNQYAQGISAYKITVSWSASANTAGNDYVVLYYEVATS